MCIRDRYMGHAVRTTNPEANVVKSVENVSFRMRNPLFMDFDYTKQYQVMHLAQRQGTGQQAPGPELRSVDSLDNFRNEYEARRAPSQAESQQERPRYEVPVRVRYEQDPTPPQSNDTGFERSPEPRNWPTRKEELKRRIFDEYPAEPVQPVQQSVEIPQKKALYIRNPIAAVPLLKYEVTNPHNIQVANKIEEKFKNERLDVNANYGRARNMFFGEDEEDLKIRRRNNPNTNDYTVNMAYGTNHRVHM
eukprot:TRINITY_DN5404_c0_g1_i3.p1 TRINITY_DN5404_c0_g1~~TRINITY_DN5404_c0_g1_i3.p1  ORF type:complete len:265 (+),score=56.51 TRINITY_DN5404_c0_g1_i3:49-795(+)